MKTNTSETFTLFASSAVTSLTPSLYTNVYGHFADYALVTCRSGKIQYTYDGTDPSFTGHTLTEDQSVGLEGDDVIRGFRMKCVTDGSVYVTYENKQVVVATAN